MAKTLIGYGASSIGVRIDVENITTRVMIVFAFSLLESALLLLIHRVLLGARGLPLPWMHELARAGINTGVALPLFLVLDRAKRRD